MSCDAHVILRTSRKPWSRYQSKQDLGVSRIVSIFVATVHVITGVRFGAPIDVISGLCVRLLHDAGVGIKRDGVFSVLGNRHCPYGSRAGAGDVEGAPVEA